MKTSRRDSDQKGQKPRNPSNKKKIFSRHMQEKLAITVLVIMLALFALSAVLYNIVEVNEEDYAKVVLTQHSTYDSRTLPYRRGDIVDRNGTILATSEQVYNLILDPSQICAGKDYQAHLDTTVDVLVECFGYDRSDLISTITKDKSAPYIRYTRRMSYDEKEAFETRKAEVNKANKEAGVTGKVRGVWFESEYQRKYPYNALACNILGFAQSDGAGGNGGIEQYYNDILIGTNGREYGYLNDDSNMETVIKPAENGNTIVSTIDANVQNMVEKRIAQWKQEMGGKQIGILVMDPRNGEILAMATDKSYDLNNPRDLTGLYTEAEIEAMTEKEQSDAWNKQWRNFCVSDTFEPGSPSKVFTVAAALEENLVKPNTYFVCDGYQIIANRLVRCDAYLRGGHGSIALDETLMVSCNDAMMQMAAMETKSTFKKYQDMFNFGRKTGIDLPGEADAATLIYQLDNMGPMDLATNSFGQNYNCTMVQMAAAFASAINGGSYYEPHVMKQVLNENGSVVRKNDSTLVRQTVSRSTSEFLRKALVRTVDEGTGKAAKVPGYAVGGKTGTAEKHPRGQRNYVVSFCGFAPEEDPQVLVYVVIDEPGVEDQAHSSFASAIFSQVMGDILPYLNVFPTRDIPMSDTQQSQLPAQEGITEETPGTEETPEGGEGESVAPKLPYEDEEYVPYETAEDGTPIYYAVPGALPGQTEGETLQQDTLPEELAPQEIGTQGSGEDQTEPVA